MARNVIERDSDTLGGTPVFAGTRVPIRILIEHLEAGDRLDDFLDGFPTVSRSQAIAVLEQAKAMLIGKVDEDAADGGRNRSPPTRPIGRLFGALKHDGPSKSLEDMERAIAEGACESAAASLQGDQAATSSVGGTGATPVRGLTDVPNG